MLKKAYQEMCEHFLRKYPEKGEELIKFFNENDYYSWALDVVADNKPETISLWESQLYRQMLGLDDEDEDILYKWLYKYNSR